MQASNVQPALDAWARLLGAAHVQADEASCARYTANTLGVARRVAGILKPGTADEVRGVVEIANRFRVPLFPFSCGRNWGLGSRAPVRDGGCLVDLSRMNRIREVNERHRYAVVEPGVTQQQLHAYLRDRHLPLLINVVGSGLGTSMLGNALDRGIGYFASRAGTLSGLEVVLGNGTLLRTGFGHMDGSRLTHIYKHGVGPALDGLFYQSNFGIVTAAGVELLPAGDSRCSILAKIDDGAKLAELVDRFAELRRSETVRMITHIGNRVRTISTLAPLVYEQLGPSASREEAEALLREEGFGPWSAVASVSGTPAQVRLAVREVQGRLRGLANVSVLDDPRLARAGRILRSLSFLRGARRKAMVLQAVAPVYGLSNGVPTSEALKGVYWGAGLEPPREGELDPDASAAGLIYLAPLFPLEGGVAREMAARVEERAAAFGLEPAMTFNLMDERCLELVLSFSFRRDDRARVEAAHRCADELVGEFVARGFPPYRLPVHQMHHVVRAEDPFWQVARDLKRVLDPNGIIAPGRYSLE